MPAIIFNVCVLPAPEGPWRTSRSASLAKRIARSNLVPSWTSPRCSSTSQITATPSTAARRDAPGNEPPRSEQHRDADDRRHRDEKVRGIVLPCLHRFVDRDRHRLRAPGDAARDHQRRAELAERARERQQQTGEDAAPRERQRDAKEDRDLVHAEGARRVLELRIDGLERGAGGLEDERERDD